MSLTKIIIIFLIIILLFGGILFFQFSKISTPTSKVTIKNQTFLVDVAKSPSELEKGLSKRKSLPKNQGMLFIFDHPDDYAFWMKQMEFPLDIIFIKNDKIVSVAENVKPPASENENLPTYHPTKPSDKVLRSEEH